MSEVYTPVEMPVIKQGLEHQCDSVNFQRATFLASIKELLYKERYAHFGSGNDRRVENDYLPGLLEVAEKYGFRRLQIGDLTQEETELLESMGIEVTDATIEIAHYPSRSRFSFPAFELKNGLNGDYSMATGHVQPKVLGRHMFTRVGDSHLVTAATFVKKL